MTFQLSSGNWNFRARAPPALSPTMVSNDTCQVSLGESLVLFHVTGPDVTDWGQEPSQHSP